MNTNELLLNVKQGEVRLPPRQTMSADGAITLLEGVVDITKGSAAALTIADPPLKYDGARLTIISKTAFAHTVSNAAGSGFNGIGAAADIGTYGGAVADNIQLIATDGEWWVENNVNVTLA